MLGARQKKSHPQVAFFENGVLSNKLLGNSHLGSVSSSVNSLLGSIASSVSSRSNSGSSRCSSSSSRSSSFNHSSSGGWRSSCGSGCWCRSFFFLAASSQGSSSDHSDQNERFVHLKYPVKKDNFRKLFLQLPTKTKQTDICVVRLAHDYTDYFHG